MGKRAWAAAAILSVTVHLGAVYFTLAKKPDIELAGGSELQSVMIGAAAFNTIQAGSIANVADSKPPEVVEAVRAKAIEQVTPTPPVTESITVKTREPVPVAPVTAQSAPPSRPVEQSETAPLESLKLEPARPQLAYAQSAAKPPDVLPAQPNTTSRENPAETKPLDSRSEPTKALEPVKAESHPAKPVQAQKPEPVAEVQLSRPEEQAPKKEVAEKLQEVKPVEQEAVQAKSVVSASEPKNTIEPVAEVPVPRTRPKDRPRKIAKTTPERPKKTKKKTRKNSDSNTKAGAGGKSGRTAQKGGSRNRAKGKSAGNSNVTNYPALVQRKLNRAKRSVGARGRRGATRDAVVAFVVKASGAVSSVRLVRSSGSAQLDKAALAAVRKAAPFPKIPAAAGRSKWPFRVPIGF
jgi:protein TonB